MKKAVVLLSGGLDSATVLYLAKSLGYRVHSLVFDYGQRHRREVEAAKGIARSAGSPYRVLKIALPWKGSSLLDRRRRLAKGHLGPQFKRGRIPATYVPARNTIFLSFALSFAESIRAQTIFIGANAVDFSGYPDCRPHFYKAFNQLSRLATKSGIEKKAIRIRTPLIHLSKAGIIRLGLKLKVPYDKTWSCYRGSLRPCGACESCLLRAKGFQEADVRDPALIKKEKGKNAG